MAGPAAALHQAMAIENGVDRAFGRNFDVAIEPAHQELTDLARTPVGLVTLQPDNQALELLRKLVGVAHRPAGPIAQSRQPLLPIAIVNLVTSLAGYAEFSAHIRHRLPV